MMKMSLQCCCGYDENVYTLMSSILSTVSMLRRSDACNWQQELQRFS